VLEGQYDEARLGKVSKAVQDGLMSALGVPPDDFFQIFHILPRSQFRHTPSFLGLRYSDDLIVLEVTFISGRPKDKRLGLLKALNDRCGDDGVGRLLESLSGRSVDHGTLHDSSRRERIFRPRPG
jgi:hypothetical protein